jgi:hypothetical protein
MPLVISDEVESALDLASISRREIEQCFENREGEGIPDDVDHLPSSPPVKVFVAPTNKGRRLKIRFTLEGDDVRLRSVAEVQALPAYSNLEETASHK